MRAAGAGPPPALRPDRRRHAAHAARARQPRHGRAADRRCEFVVVRDPDVRHQLARTYRQGWSIYRRVLRTRGRDDAAPRGPPMGGRPLRGRPGASSSPACAAAGPCSPPSAPPRSTRGASRPCRTCCSRRAAVGLGGAASTLALWSGWEARRTLGLPRIGHAGRRRPARPPARRARRRPASPPLGNLVHLDRYGHQPFRGRVRALIGRKRPSARRRSPGAHAA